MPIKTDLNSLRSGVAAGFAVISLSAPVSASTLPRVDFSGAQTIIAVGLLDANVDYGITNAFSAGLSMMTNQLTLNSGSQSFAGTIAGRGTLRLLGAPGSACLGVTLSGGMTPASQVTGLGSAVATSNFLGWVQPALNASLPLGPIVFRGTLGPVIPMQGNVQWIWPNLELAIPLNRNHEVTLGGNALLGWRGTW